MRPRGPTRETPSSAAQNPGWTSERNLFGSFPFPKRTSQSSCFKWRCRLETPTGIGFFERSIRADARILVLDEATSSIDSITEQLIQDALATLMTDRTAVVIAHRLSTIRKVDRILVFDAGRIVEEGSHAELVRRPAGHYRRLVEMQTFGFADKIELESTG